MGERPASADSARSGSSVNSIPPLPPLPASSGSTFPPQRSSVISINSQIDGKNKFSASFLATPSTVSSPVKNLQKRLLTKEWNQRKKNIFDQIFSVRNNKRLFFKSRIRMDFFVMDQTLCRQTRTAR